MKNLREFRFNVVLSSVGNPDFGQDPSCSLPGVPTLTLGCHSLKAAAKACQRYIRQYGLGGGNWSGGNVRDNRTGKIVAYVSYNGRVWQSGPGREAFPAV